MDGPDYVVAATETFREAGRNSDPDLARTYRSLAGAYLALARFRDRMEQHRFENRESPKQETRQER